MGIPLFSYSCVIFHAASGSADLSGLQGGLRGVRGGEGQFWRVQGGVKRDAVKQITLQLESQKMRRIV